MSLPNGQPFADGTIYFKIEKDTKTFTAHNADDDSPLKISLEADFGSKTVVLEPWIYFLDLYNNNGDYDDEIVITDDGRTPSDIDEAMMRLDDQYVAQNGEVDFSLADSIQLASEFIYGEKLPDWGQAWNGDIKIEGYITDSGGYVKRLSDEGNAAVSKIEQYNGMAGGVKLASLASEVLNVIAKSGSGSNGLTIIEKTIDSLDPTPLETNALHIVAPDELTADNNVLTLPEVQLVM